MNNKKPGTLFAFLLLILCGVLTWFFVVAEDFYDYTAGSVESAASSVPLDKDDLTKLTAPSQEKLNTEIKFRNFFITVPGAKKVELQADFNGWGTVPLILKPYARGYFEISLALASGEYKYVFVVDGKDVLDPSNLDRVEENGRMVCIKTVK